MMVETMDHGEEDCAARHLARLAERVDGAGRGPRRRARGPEDHGRGDAVQVGHGDESVALRAPTQPIHPPRLLAPNARVAGRGEIAGEAPRPPSYKRS